MYFLKGIKLHGINRWHSISDNIALKRNEQKIPYAQITSTTTIKGMAMCIYFKRIKGLQCHRSLHPKTIKVPPLWGYSMIGRSTLIVNNKSIQSRNCSNRQCNL